MREAYKVILDFLQYCRVSTLMTHLVLYFSMAYKKVLIVY